MPRETSRYFIFDRRKRRAAIGVDYVLRGLFRIGSRLRPVHGKAVDLSTAGLSRILVIQLDHLGDAILATPVYAAIKHAYPEAHLTVLLRPSSAELLQHDQHIDDLVPHTPPWWGAGGGDGAFSAQLAALVRFVPQYLRLLRELRGRDYDLAIDLRGDLRHILLYTYLCRARHRVGYQRTGGDYLLTHALEFDPEMHIAARNLRLLEPLGIKDVDARVEIRVSGEDEDRVGRVLAEAGIRADDALVVVHPGSRVGAKRWSSERFALLLEWMAQAYQVAILLVGDSTERELCQDITSLAPTASAVVLAGRLSLLEVAALLKRAQLFVGVDSSVQHLAAAAHTPSVVLHGPTDPQVCGMWGAQTVALLVRQPCWPCFHNRCPITQHGRGLCMESINGEDVCAAVESLNVLGRTPCAFPQARTAPERGPRVDELVASRQDYRTEALR